VVRGSTRSVRRRWRSCPLWVGCRECRAPEIRVKAMEGAEDLEVQALKDSPAYGVRNVQVVAAGTGEAVPGAVICGWCCRSVALYKR
jgi:hypothetical protein